MREDVTISNTADVTVVCTVTVNAAADFADLFEVKTGRNQPVAAAAATAAASTLTFETRGGNAATAS